MHFTLADLVTDIIQNACESGAALVELDIRETGGQFRFLVRDNGKGMTSREMDRAVEPFVTDGIKHPNRKVGLGLPFLIQTADQSGGGWNARSEKGKGTEITAWFDTGNIDTPPVGDLSGMFRTVMLFEGPDEMWIRRFKQQEGVSVNDEQQPPDYEVRKSELIKALGGFEDAGSLILLDRYLRSLEEDESAE